MKKSLSNALYMVPAFFFLFLGAVGVVIPILPTTPFLLLAAFFFTKGSPRFNRWFLRTALYRNHLEDFIRTRSMTLRKKLFIVIPVSLMLFVTAWMMDKIALRVFILTLVLFIWYYFTFQIRTIKDKSDISG